MVEQAEPAAASVDGLPTCRECRGAHTVEQHDRFRATFDAIVRAQEAAQREVESVQGAADGPQDAQPEDDPEDAQREGEREHVLAADPQRRILSKAKMEQMMRASPACRPVAASSAGQGTEAGT